MGGSYGDRTELPRISLIDSLVDDHDLALFSTVHSHRGLLGYSCGAGTEMDPVRILSRYVCHPDMVYVARFGRVRLGFWVPDTIRG